MIDIYNEEIPENVSASETRPPVMFAVVSYGYTGGCLVEHEKP